MDFSMDSKPEPVVVCPDMYVEDAPKCSIRKSRQDRLQSKNLRNIGKAYISSTGKLVKGRVMGTLEPCRMECVKRIPEEDRLKCFQHYWSLGSRDKRANYVSSLITIKDKKSQKLMSSNRSCACSYKLIINNKDTPVCRNCFIKSLGETKGFVEIVLSKKKTNKNGIVSSDGRGLASPKNKRTEQELKVVNDHINSYLDTETHCEPTQQTKKVVKSNMTMSKMYELYKKQTENPVSLSLYARCFQQKKLELMKSKYITFADVTQIKSKTLVTEP